MKKYFGQWDNYEEMCNSWGDVVKTPFPYSDDEVLFASYGCENYEGDAIVIFVHDGKLYEVNGSHCSCHGLESMSYGGDEESQWEPEETSWKALSKRTLREDQHEEEARLYFGQMVGRAQALLG